MAQLNIYLDSKTEKEVRKAAERHALSLSKWAGDVLRRAAMSEQVWPENYADLLGSIDDETFIAPPDSPAHFDQPVCFDS